MGGWGGVIAGAALGGISGVGSAMAEDAILQDKERMQRERDVALAELQKTNQIAIHAANTQTDIAAVAPRAKAASDAAALTAEQDAATASTKITAEGKARAKLELDPEVQAAEQAKAMTTAKGQAAASKYIEDNRTPEQQKKADLELKKLGAQINKENADAGAAGAHAKYYGIMGDVAKQDADTKAKLADTKAETAANKEDKWVVDKSDSAKSTGPGGIVRMEVEPAQMPTPAKPGIMGTAWGAKEAKPYKAPTYVYSTPNGTQLSYEEVAKVVGGKAEDFARTEADKPAAVAPVKPAAIGNPIVPPGYIPIGKDKATGKTVYRGPDGEQYVQ